MSLFQTTPATFTTFAPPAQRDDRVSYDRIRMTLEHGGQKACVEFEGDTASVCLELARVCTIAVGFLESSWEDAILDEAELVREKDRKQERELTGCVCGRCAPEEA
jgi:hypothetical protein